MCGKFLIGFVTHAAFFAIAVAQEDRCPQPLYVVWELTEATQLSGSSARHNWALDSLGLADRATNPPAGMIVRGPRKVVEPYRHVEGRVILVSRAPHVEFQTATFRSVRGEKEYLQRLEELESGYEARREGEPEATITRNGPPERRELVYQRDWMEEERERTVEYIRGARVEGSRVIADRNNNVRMVPQSLTMRSFARLDGHLMLNGRTSAVFEIPASALTRNAMLREDDLTHYVDVSGISGKTRKMIWERLLATKNTALQQFDNESDADYQARRALGENHIELMRSALFDVDSAWLSCNYRDESKPIQITGGVNVGADTELQRLLRRIGRAKSRLPEIDSDDEVFSLHWASRIPEQTAQFLRAAVNALRVRFPSAHIPDVADWTIDDGVLELRLSGRANLENGLACLGALRVSNPSDDAQQALAQFLTAIPALAVQQIVSEQGASFLRISLSPLAQLKTEKLPEWEFMKLPQFAFLQFRGNVLWFSLGGQNAWKMLDAELVAQDEEDANDKPLDGIGYVLKCELNLEQVTTARGEKSGLKQYVAEFERGYSRWTADRHLEILSGVMDMDLRCPDDYEFATVFEKALTDRPGRGRLEVFNVPEGVRAEATLDRSLALLYFGRQSLNFRDMNKVWAKAMTIKPAPPQAPPSSLLQAGADH